MTRSDSALPAEMPTNLLIVSNNTDDELLVEPPGHNFPALIFGVLLIVAIICGNLLVCLSVYTEKALKTTTNYFIVSLAVADLMLSVLVLPLFVYTEFQDGTWSLDMTVCDGLMTMDVMLCTASIFNLCAISVDRFIAVSIPLNYNRKHVDQRQIVLLSATWILALAVASPIMFGINNTPGRDPTECKLENDDYVLYSSVCSFFIPCPIMVLLYCGMFRGLRNWEEARKAKLRNSIQACRKLQEPDGSLPPLVAAASLPQPLAQQQPVVVAVIEREPTENTIEELDPYPSQDRPFPSAEYRDGPAPRTVRTLSYNDIKFTPNAHKKKRPKINGRERKAMKVLPIVVGAFLFCWTPFFVVHTMRARCQSCHIPNSLMSVVTWLGYVNSAVNPIIYTVFNTEFRNFFKKFLHNCWSRLDH